MAWQKCRYGGNCCSRSIRRCCRYRNSGHETHSLLVFQHAPQTPQNSAYVLLTNSSQRFQVISRDAVHIQTTLSTIYCILVQVYPLDFKLLTYLLSHLHIRFTFSTIAQINHFLALVFQNFFVIYLLSLLNFKPFLLNHISKPSYRPFPSFQMSIFNCA